MDKKDHIIGWLGMVLSLEPGRLTESFYFDRKEQLFFSIHVMDYFMVTEDLEIDPASTTNMSEASLQTIVHWMKRLEEDTDSIIQIPQRGITDKTLREIQAREYILEHQIDLGTARVWEIDSDVSVKVDLTTKTEGHSKATKKWWEFWK